jgi:hypothetical protein
VTGVTWQSICFAILSTAWAGKGFWTAGAGDAQERSRGCRPATTVDSRDNGAGILAPPRCQTRSGSTYSVSLICLKMTCCNRLISAVVPEKLRSKIRLPSSSRILIVKPLRETSGRPTARRCRIRDDHTQTITLDIKAKTEVATLKRDQTSVFLIAPPLVLISVRMLLWRTVFPEGTRLISVRLCL